MSDVLFLMNVPIAFKPVRLGAVLFWAAGKLTGLLSPEGSGTVNRKVNFLQARNSLRSRLLGLVRSLAEDYGITDAFEIEIMCPGELSDEDVVIFGSDVAEFEWLSRAKKLDAIRFPKRNGGGCPVNGCPLIHP